MSEATNRHAVEHLRYALGFVIGGGRPNIVAPHLRLVPFPVPLYVHPTTRYATVLTASRVVAVLGEAIHPRYPDLDLEGIAALLAARFDSRQTEVDQLVGRFVVISGTDLHDLGLQTDAIAMRAVFYTFASDGRLIAGTHAKLVADAALGYPASVAPKPFALGYPGMTTPYPGVLRLPANVELMLADGRLRRFFPLEKIQPTTIEDAWAVAFDRAATVVGEWARRRPVLVSLTGGLDSRTTLAAARKHWSQLTFFTYDRGDPGHAIDMCVAQDIAGALGIKHLAIDFSADRPSAELLKVIRDNSYGSHQRKLAAAYHARFGEQRFLHVRTNLLELGRSNLFAKGNKRPQLQGGLTTPGRMADFYIRSGKVDPIEHVEPAFAEYVERTAFARTLGLASTWDLFFVEHRMGAWHSGVVLESDIAFDTVIAFNSREIVRHWMGVPEEVRSTASHLREMIESLLPELQRIPINPKQYPLAAPSEQFRSTLPNT